MTFNPVGVVASETTSPVYGVAEQPINRADTAAREAQATERLVKNRDRFIESSL
jgi:hypothetical protein